MKNLYNLECLDGDNTKLYAIKIDEDTNGLQAGDLAIVEVGRVKPGELAGVVQGGQAKVTRIDGNTPKESILGRVTAFQRRIIA